MFNKGEKQSSTLSCDSSYYVESVALIFKTEVQSQIPINKDKMVLLFFRQRISIKVKCV